jgi:16S rRNA (uracil1498-N3)-methyltransferase
VKLTDAVVADRESPIECVLAQAISSGERMDITLQKAVELGICAVRPLYSERSIVRLDESRTVKRMAHWEQVIISACEQCGRNVVPDIVPPDALMNWLATLSQSGGDELRVLLSPGAPMRLADLARPATVTLLAGPEGGLTDVEQEAAISRGFIAVRLGPRVLRTETAALTALAAINTLWGDF